MRYHRACAKRGRRQRLYYLWKCLNFRQARCKTYKHYGNTTREASGIIKAGDLVGVSDWTCPMFAKVISKNPFVMTRKKEKDTYYFVCLKLPWNGTRHNTMVGGMFYCGCDDWIFGTPLGIRHENIYQFNGPELNKLHLQESEDGKMHISEQNGVVIYGSYVGRCGD